MKKVLVRKGIVLLLAVSMLFSAAACGKKDNVREKQKMSDADKDAVYTYEAIDLNRDENESGYVQFVGDSMYSIVYVYDEETYESTQYCIIYGMNGKEKSRFVIPQGWDDSSSYGINQILLSPAGEIYGTKYTYTSSENQATGEWEWNEYHSLVKLDNQGNELWEVSLGSTGSSQVDDGGAYYGVHRLLCDNAGNVWVFDTVSYTCYDKDGNKGVSIPCLENSTGDAYLTKEGNIIVGQYNDTTGIDFFEIDIKSGKLIDKALEMPEGYEQYTFYSAGAGKWDMYASNNLGIWAFNWGDKKMTKVMDFMLSDFDGLHMYNINVLSDDQFIAYYADMEYNPSVAKFTKVPKAEVADKYIMTLASYYLDNDVRKQVIEFNRSHEDVRITLVDYSNFNNSENWEQGMENLKSDILNGNVPDILVAPSNFDLGMYINKGLFADLYTLMNEDETIKKEDYLQNILALGEYEGKLYELIPKFSAVTWSGRKSDVGDGFGWTFDDVQALLDKKGENVNLFPNDTNRNGVLYYGINMAFDQFYNSNTGECHFDTPEFVQFLELMNQYPEDVSEIYDDENYWVTYENQWRNGETVLKYEWITDFQNYVQNSQGYFGEPISYIGFPTKDGSGSAAYTDFTFAIAQESAFKDEAWEYISYFIKDEYQDNIEYGFPVKLSAIDKKAQKEMKPYTWVDEETGEEIIEPLYFWIGDKEITLKMPTKEECQYVIDFLKSIDYRQKDVSDITAIIEEDAAAYFEGQKTADQVADTIQSRVKILVSEKR